jgi:hypothetical protein
LRNDAPIRYPRKRTKPPKPAPSLPRTRCPSRARRCGGGLVRR